MRQASISITTTGSEIANNGGNNRLKFTPNALREIRGPEDLTDNNDESQDGDGSESMGESTSDPEDEESTSESRNPTNVRRAGQPQDRRENIQLQVERIRPLLLAAMSSRCHCGTGFGPANDAGLSLGEMAFRFRQNVSADCVVAPGEQFRFPVKGLYPDGWPDHNMPLLLSGLQAGGEGQLKLSFRKSEYLFRNKIHESATKHGVEGFPMTIHSKYDIDSFMARLECASACKQPFSLSFVPRYMRQIRQSMVVEMGSVDVTKCKHVEFGRPTTTSALVTYAVFPHMDTSVQNNFLNQEQQTTWLNNIVIPSLRSSCEQDLLQYIPVSYEDVNLKAGIKQEETQKISSEMQKVAVDKVLPASCLERLWREIVTRSNATGSSSHDNFSDPFLVVCGHDLKLHCQRSKPAEAVTEFLGMLDHTYDRSKIVPEDAWLDLGRNDVPIITDENVKADIGPITLLRKASCSEQWISSFRCPGQGTFKTRENQYPICGTRDAGNGSVDLTKSNLHRSQGGIAHAKAYSLHKEVLYSPVKGIVPFGNLLLEAIGFDQEHIEEWYLLNSERGGARGRHRSETLKQQFAHTFLRVNTAMEMQKRSTFGVRQEYRIKLEVAEALDMEELAGLQDGETAVVSTADNTLSEDNGHDLFWILPTAEVNFFFQTECLRWCCCIAAVASQVQTAPGLEETDRRQQLENGIMMQVMVRALRCSMAGKSLSLYGSMWKYGQYQRQEAQSSGRKIRRTVTGLGMGRLFKDTGMIFVPEDFFEPGHRKVSQRLIASGQLSIGSNALQTVLKSKSGLQKTVGRSARVLSKLAEAPDLTAAGIRLDTREGCRMWSDWVQTLGEWAVSGLVKCTWDTVALRMGEDIAHGRREWTSQTEVQKKMLIKQCQKEARKIICNRIGRETYQGYHGLTPNMVLEALNANAQVLNEIISKIRPKPPNGESQFPTSGASGLWSDKMYDLFMIEPEGRGGKHGWDSKFFRRRYRSVIKIAQKELGEQDGRRAMENVVQGLVVKHIWIALQFDHDKFSVTAKFNLRTLSQERREEVQTMSQTAKMRWIIPSLPKEDGKDYIFALERHNDRDGLIPQPYQNQLLEDYRELIRWRPGRRQISVPSYTTQSQSWVSNLQMSPERLGISTSMNNLLSIIDDLKDDGRYAESDSDNSVDEEDEFEEVEYN